jgi:hypothetical protein
VIKMRGRGARKGYPRALLAENAKVDSDSDDESESGGEQNSDSSDDGSNSSKESSEEEEVEAIKKKNKVGLDKRFPRGSYIFRVMPWDKLSPFLGGMITNYHLYEQSSEPAGRVVFPC